MQFHLHYLIEMFFLCKFIICTFLLVCLHSILWQWTLGCYSYMSIIWFLVTPLSSNLQALGYVHGAQVVRAPEAVHGRLRWLTYCLYFFFYHIRSYNNWACIFVYRFPSAKLNILFWFDIITNNYWGKDWCMNDAN